MSTALLITIPLMLLAIVVAVAPVLLMSIREHRLATGQRSRREVPALSPPVRTPPPKVGQSVDARSAVVVLEEATIAVNRLRALREGPTDSGVDESLRIASDDLHRALVSLGDAGR